MNKRQVNYDQEERKKERKGAASVKNKFHRINSRGEVRRGEAK